MTHYKEYSRKPEASVGCNGRGPGALRKAVAEHEEGEPGPLGSFFWGGL